MAAARTGRHPHAGSAGTGERCWPPAESVLSKAQSSPCRVKSQLIGAPFRKICLLVLSVLDWGIILHSPHPYIYVCVFNIFSFPAILLNKQLFIFDCIGS